MFGATNRFCVWLYVDRLPCSWRLLGANSIKASPGSQELFSPEFLPDGTLIRRSNGKQLICHRHPPRAILGAVLRMKLPENTKMFLNHLAVCTWSLQPTDPANLVQQLQAIGVNRVQLDMDPLREQPAVWGRTGEILRQGGIQIVSGMFRTVGEDYTTPETIRLTGGVVPDATWEQNWKNLQGTVQVAKQLGVQLLTFHAGFLPHDPADPTFSKLLGRIRQMSDLFAKNGLTLSFETGQETAQDLIRFMDQLQAPNVAVNFDPAKHAVV